MMIKDSPHLTLYEDRSALAEAEQSLKSAFERSNFPAVLLQLRSLLRILRSHTDADDAEWTQMADFFRTALTLAKSQPDTITALKETCLLADLFPTVKSAVAACEAYDALGCALMKTQDYELAAKCLHKAISAAMALDDRAVNRAANYLHLCEAYFHQGKYKHAVRYGAQAAIYAEQQIESSTSDSVLHDLQAIYDFLARSEEALKRFDRSRYWQKRSLLVFNSCARGEASSQSPDIRSRLRRVVYETSHSGPPSSVQSPRVSGKREQEATTLPDIAQKEGVKGWIRSPPHCGSADATPTAHDFRLLTRSHDFKASLLPTSEIPESPDHPQFPPPEQPAPFTLLYQCWKKLKSGPFAHIRIGEVPPDCWVIDLKCSDGRLSVEERLGPHHAWRRLQPQVLASLLQLGPKGELVLSGEDSQRLELYREKRDFDNTTYQVVYCADPELRRVEIKAEGAGKRLRKAVLNDIALASKQDTVCYVRDVLAPQVRIVDNQITVVPTQGPLPPAKTKLLHSSSGAAYTDINRKVLQTSSSPSSKRPSRCDPPLASKSESPSTARIERPKEDVAEKVYYVPDDVQMPMSDSKFVIRISETHNGTKEYKRDYQHLKEVGQSCAARVMSPPEFDTSPKLDRNSLFERLRRAKETSNSPLALKRRSIGS